MSGRCLEEGSECPYCSGRLYYPEPENCSCHISPPCHYHTSVVLTCEECGADEFDPCTRCNGTGSIPVYRNRHGQIDYIDGQQSGEWATCSICSGVGYR